MLTLHVNPGQAFFSEQSFMGTFSVLLCWCVEEDEVSATLKHAVITINSAAHGDRGHPLFSCLSHLDSQQCKCTHHYLSNDVDATTSSVPELASAACDTFIVFSHFYCYASCLRKGRRMGLDWCYHSCCRLCRIHRLCRCSCAGTTEVSARVIAKAVIVAASAAVLAVVPVCVTTAHATAASATAGFSRPSGCRRCTCSIALSGPNQPCFNSGLSSLDWVVHLPTEYHECH
jgi:hypothetical protein